MLSKVYDFEFSNDERDLQLKYEIVVKFMVSHAQYSSVNPQHLYSKHNRLFLTYLLPPVGINMFKSNSMHLIIYFTSQFQ